METMTILGLTMAVGVVIEFIACSTVILRSAITKEEPESAKKEKEIKEAA